MKRIKEHRASIVLLGVLFILYFLAPFFIKLNPYIEDQFISIALLGEKREMNSYFPNGKPEIPINEDIYLNWFINIYNHMDKTQYVAIKIKMLDSIENLPKINQCTSSDLAEIYEFRRIIGINQTIELNFSWKIIEASMNNSSITINTMSINDVQLDNNITYFNKHLILLFELWVYDPSLKTFSFQWLGSDDIRCAWNHIGFDIIS